jgi:hypothetical protein
VYVRRRGNRCHKGRATGRQDLSCSRFLSRSRFQPPVNLDSLPPLSFVASEQKFVWCVCLLVRRTSAIKRSFSTRSACNCFCTSTEVPSFKACRHRDMTHQCPGRVSNREWGGGWRRQLRAWRKKSLLVKGLRVNDRPDFPSASAPVQHSPVEDAHFPHVAVRSPVPALRLTVVAPSKRRLRVGRERASL